MKRSSSDSETLNLRADELNLLKLIRDGKIIVLLMRPDEAEVVNDLIGETILTGQDTTGRLTWVSERLSRAISESTQLREETNGR